MSEVTFRITDTNPSVKVTMVDENITTQKNIHLEELITELVSNYKISTDLLPQGTRLYKGAGSDYVACVEIAAKVRDFTISKYKDGNKLTDEVIQIPYPTCLFIFFIQNKKVYELKLFALKHPLQTIGKDKLYWFPFSNVYQDGRICWGNAGVSLKVNKPMEMVGIINQFLGSTFNGDVAQNNVKFTKDCGFSDFWGLVKALTGKPEFPLELLKETNQELKNILESINGEDDE